MVDPSLNDLGQQTPKRRRPKPTTRERVIAAGFAGDLDAVVREAAHGDPAVRIAVMNAMDRLGQLSVAHLISLFEDEDPRVRRRALELSTSIRGRGVNTTLVAALLATLDDQDPLVVDGACWALGERRIKMAVAPLCLIARNHVDPRCREAAVAALGAIGDEGGRATIISCLDDKPNIRRRVVVALASFDGDDVNQALDRCRVDHDWQVRQAVEMLERSSPLN